MRGCLERLSFYRLAFSSRASLRLHRVQFLGKVSREGQVHDRCAHQIRNIARQILGWYN